MATANQIKYRIGQAKKTIVKLNKEVTATKNKIKKLESALKKAKAAPKAKPRKRWLLKRKGLSRGKKLLLRERDRSPERDNKHFRFRSKLQGNIGDIDLPTAGVNHT